MNVYYREEEIVRCLRLGGHDVPPGHFLKLTEHGLLYRTTEVRPDNGIDQFYDEELGKPHPGSDRNSEHMKQLYGELPEEPSDLEKKLGFNPDFVDGEDFCEE